MSPITANLLWKRGSECSGGYIRDLSQQKVKDSLLSQLCQVEAQSTLSLYFCYYTSTFFVTILKKGKQIAVQRYLIYLN